MAIMADLHEKAGDIFTEVSMGVLFWGSMSPIYYRVYEFTVLVFIVTKLVNMNHTLVFIITNTGSSSL